MDNYKLEVSEFEIKSELGCRNTPVLKYSIKYPQFISSKFQLFISRLNYYYKEKACSLARYCEHELYESAVELYCDSISNGFPFHEYEFLSEYTITYNQNCALSLYFDQYQYTGGANGTTTRESDTWNLQTGREIQLSELFPSTKNYKAYIEKEINQQIADQIQNTNSYYFDDYEQLVVQYFNPKDFYLTAYSLSIYYQEITIAPHSSGFPVFDFPYEESQAVQPECARNHKLIVSSEINPYRIRSELLMSATDEVGVFTPDAAIEVWAKGLKERSAALQYIVMTKRYKKVYADMLEENTTNWVTGVSSPWIENYCVLKKEPLQDGSFLFEVKFDTATSTGFWGSYCAKVTVVIEDGFWRIGDIQANDELNIYMGDYSS